MKTIKIKVLPETDCCEGCIYEEQYNLKCVEAMKTLTGYDCGIDEVIFTHDEKWVKLTKENINVGETVRLGENCKIKDDNKIVHIGNTSFAFTFDGEVYTRTIGEDYGMVLYIKE